MAFDLDAYEPVAARLARWRFIVTGEKNPVTGEKCLPRVITHLVHYGDNRCVFRAELFIDDTLISTGWAEETRGEGMVNRTSHLENAETSAVGRALANAGQGGTDPAKRPSREEMAKVVRNGDRILPTGSEHGTSTASPKQLGFIRRLASDRGLASTEDMAVGIAAVLGTEVPIDKLTPAQASRVIDAWNRPA